MNVGIHTTFWRFAAVLFTCAELFGAGLPAAAIATAASRQG
jgi:hypothetical protein